MKISLKRMISLFLIVVLFINTTLVDVKAENSVERIKENEVIFEGDNFRVTYAVSASWNTGYNVLVEIENTGKDDIFNWAIQFPEYDTINNIWNAEIIEYKDSVYSIKNAGWNQDILVGNSVSFGFTASGNLDYLPNVFMMPVYETEVLENDYDAEINIENEWYGGYKAELKIINKSDDAICNWIISFDYERDITQVFNGEIVERTGNRYTIKFCSYNRNISGNDSLSVGIMGTDVEKSAEISNIKLVQSVIDINDKVQLEDGEIDKNYLLGEVLIPLQIENPDIVISDIKLSDDYDGDGLSLIEEYNCSTDPFSMDSDGDRVDDNTELVLGTNPNYVDSDADGLFDGTEYEILFNPLENDSDKDGIYDSEEITTQNVVYSPNNSDLENGLSVEPYISITGIGDYNRKIYIEDSSYDTLKSDLEYIVGKPFEFIHNENLEFESSTLFFEISDEVLTNTNIVDLVIAYYNEDICAYEILDTQYDIERKIIYSHVEHYSTYAVINMRKYITAISTKLFDTSNNSDSVDTVVYNGNVYIVVNEGMSWEEASKKCYEMGGHLVTIENEDEQQFVNNLMKQNDEKNFYWIGLSGLDNQYSWVTGKKLIYQNWAKGEPNNLKENFVHMYAKDYDEFKLGQWNDTYNYFELEGAYYHGKNNGYICEIEKNNIIKDGECYIKLVNGKDVLLDKNPQLGDKTVDTDGDGNSDIDELGVETTIEFYDIYLKKKCKYTAYTFESNPAVRDTDGDGLNDGVDCNPNRYDIRVIRDEYDVEVSRGYNCKAMKFNNGKVWYYLNCSAEEYNSNWKWSWKAKHFVARIIVDHNSKYDFGITELTAIIKDTEGIRIYLNSKQELADSLFLELYGRKPVSYQHIGENTYKKLGTGDYGSGSYNNGFIITEAESIFTLKPYNVSDKYIMSTVSRAVIKSIFTNIVYELAGYVVFSSASKLVEYNVERLHRFMETRGIDESYDFYRKYVTKSDKDGVLSALTKNVDDIDVDIPIEAKNIAAYVKSNNGSPMYGYKGGRTYKNIPLEEGAQKLPEGIIYKEYDIYPYIKGVNRGKERIVIGDDGTVWYTNDHYYSFIEIK